MDFIIGVARRQSDHPILGLPFEWRSKGLGWVSVFDPVASYCQCKGWWGLDEGWT